MPRNPILVVDDDLTVRMVITLQLDKLGYAADLAADGLEAVKRVQRHRYLLILMDLQMPHLDGFDAAIAIRRYEKEQGLEAVPIVAVTASGLGNMEKCLAAGMNDYCQKPSTVPALKAITDKWIAPEKLEEFESVENETIDKSLS